MNGLRGQAIRDAILSVLHKPRIGQGHYLGPASGAHQRAMRGRDRGSSVSCRPVSSDASARATQRAERLLLDLLLDLRELRLCEIPVTASIGVAVQSAFAFGIMGFDQLFKLAREAVCEARTSGYNRVFVRDR